MNIIPIGERILLKQIKQGEERTKSGLYLPKSGQERKEGEVAAMGAQRDGNQNSLPLKKGDRVIYGGYGAEEIEVDGEKYIIVEFKDIIARIE